MDSLHKGGRMEQFWTGLGLADIPCIFSCLGRLFTHVTDRQINRRVALFDSGEGTNFSACLLPRAYTLHCAMLLYY